jgi:outer membrane protein TolC
MKRGFFKAAALLMLIGAGMTGRAQQRHEFSAQDCIEYAKLHNVQVRNALLDVQIQQQTNREITASAYPQVSASASVTDNLKLMTQLLPGEFFGQPPGTYVPVTFGTKYIANGGVSLQQLLFDGQVFVGLQARKTSIDYFDKSKEVTEELIRTNIYKAYYQLVASRNQIQILDANITRLERLHHDNQAMYQNGFAEQIDVNKASVQLANVQTEKEKALNSINNGYLGLKILMGMPVKDTLILTDSVSYADIRSGVLENSVFNYSDRKEYQLAEMGIKLRQYDIKRYKYTYIPTISLSANYNKNAQRNQFNFFKGGQNWFTSAYVNLSINIPIFDGFAKDARIKRARLQLQQSQNTLDNLKLTIDQEVSQAINNYNSAIRTLDNQKKNMDLAEVVYNQTKKKFEAGLGSQLEITSAQSDLQVAQSNYINAMYDAIIAKIDFLKATGKLK